MVTDPNTGMPEIPARMTADGHSNWRWEVIETFPLLGHNNPRTYAVRLMLHRPATVKQEEVAFEVKRGFWWKIFHPDTPREYRKEMRDIPVEERWIEFMGLPVKGDLTPESIYATAVRVLEAIEERHRATSLLGTYPPKRLTHSED